MMGSWQRVARKNGKVDDAKRQEPLINQALKSACIIYVAILKTLVQMKDDLAESLPIKNTPPPHTHTHTKNKPTILTWQPYTKLKGSRMGRSDKVSLWCVALLINTRFRFFILE